MLHYCLLLYVPCTLLMSRVIHIDPLLFIVLFIFLEPSVLVISRLDIPLIAPVNSIVVNILLSGSVLVWTTAK
jgi:hypothetical protein